MRRHLGCFPFASILFKHQPSENSPHISRKKNLFGELGEEKSKSESIKSKSFRRVCCLLLRLFCFRYCCFCLTIQRGRLAFRWHVWGEVRQSTRAAWNVSQITPGRAGIRAGGRPAGRALESQCCPLNLQALSTPLWTTLWWANQRVCQWEA